MIRILAVISFILSIISIFLNAGDKIRIHKEAGDSYSCLHSKAQTFLDIEINVLDEIDIKSKIFKLRDERDELNSKYTQPLLLGYLGAKFGIWLGEATNKVDKE